MRSRKRLGLTDTRLVYYVLVTNYDVGGGDLLFFKANSYKGLYAKVYLRMKAKNYSV